jgi:AAA15 family ATPase/GTPase
MIEYIALTNFFSFKNRTEFCLKATKEKPRGTFSDGDWWTEVDGIKLLKAAFLLGNNGSGKTNFLNGLSVLNELITVNRDSKASSRYRLPDVPFLLSEETKNAPSAIEVAFHTAGYRYTYYISWKPDYIVEERLLRQEGKKKEKLIFSREFSKEKDLVVVTYPKSTTIPLPVQELINQNILKYSSVISIYDNKNFECEDIRNVYNYFRFVDLWNVKKYELATMLARRSNEVLLKPIILSILKDMGSTIRNYKIDTLTFDINEDEREFLLTRMSEEEYRANFPGDRRTVRKLQFGYRVKEKEETNWLPESLESEGTLEAIRLIIVLFDSIWRNTPIAIDECAQSIHPKALEFILSFFLRSSDTAQVFIATQALVLLKWDNLRRDSIRFFEKNKETGCSSFTTINNRTLHRNNQIYDLYMNKTFGGAVKILEKEPWKETLEKITRCMLKREWDD